MWPNIFCEYDVWSSQAKLNEEYPCHHSCSALMCSMGAVQAIVIALCVDRDWMEWRLGYDIRLLTMAYSVCSYKFKNLIHIHC